MSSQNYDSSDWLKALQSDARVVVEHTAPGQVIVALDMVNFEQPYATPVDGMSTIGHASW